jgi:hypothetical protein
MRYFLLVLILSFFSTSLAEAHRSGCHRWHSCPSDSGSYICGDIGKCSGCPDNQYCESGHPKLSSSSPSPESKVGQNNSITIPAYNRKDWPHWIDQDNDCQNTRHEILIRDSTEPVRFKTSKGCIVVTGKWLGPYTGQTFLQASDLDIDHVVPLAYAHRNGGASWDKERKMEFANDPDNLLAVDDSTNQSKGSKGPAEWRPPKKDYWCEYSEKWRRVKTRYNLITSKQEERMLKEIQQECDGRDSEN